MYPIKRKFGIELIYLHECCLPCICEKNKNSYSQTSWCMQFCTCFLASKERYNYCEELRLLLLYHTKVKKKLHQFNYHHNLYMQWVNNTKLTCETSKSTYPLLSRQISQERRLNYNFINLLNFFCKIKLSSDIALKADNVIFTNI